MELQLWVFIYVEELGDPETEMVPGQKGEALPVDWVCPLWGMGKEDFEEIS